MNVEQFEYMISNNRIEKGDRFWYFGLAYNPDHSRPLLNYPLAEAEWYSEGWGSYLHQVSPKTGRVLKSKVVNFRNSWSDVGNLRRAEHIQIFDNKEEAVEAYRAYLEQKTAEINHLIEQKTTMYNNWLADAQAPLAE